MRGQPVQWVSVFLDVPVELVDATVGYWSAVTGSWLGEAVGDHGEFLPLQPSPGDPCLWVQRIETGRVATHPDLYVADVEAVAKMRSTWARQSSDGSTGSWCCPPRVGCRSALSGTAASPCGPSRSVTRADGASSTRSAWTC